MVYTGKNDNAGKSDIVVRVGKFPTQGKKLVIQKGSTIISVSAEDCANFFNAVSDACAFSSQYKLVPTFEVAKPCSDYEELCDTCPSR